VEEIKAERKTANRKHDYWIGRLKHFFVPFVTRHPQRNTRKAKLTFLPPRLMLNFSKPTTSLPLSFLLIE
jgi:hypothetical protein